MSYSVTDTFYSSSPNIGMYVMNKNKCVLVSYITYESAYRNLK